MDRIQVDRVSKRYVLGERQNLRETVSGLARRRRPGTSELWSLRDVSFSVADGESVGIVGRNGAGKSTLLKVLMRITSPTSGESRTRGRVAALLEVGTGFHPELTGRENVFLNAAVLGMSRAETVRRFDEIVDFAGTERFLDTPVKRYSSGMYLRLAFAVAAHLEPDVLIVDEVLAVGDAEFQRKCLGRMSQAESEGRTVVFVSHDLASLQRLCARSLWLEAGSVRDDGPTPHILRSYLSDGFVPSDGQVVAGDGSTVAVHKVVVASQRGGTDSALLQEDPLLVRLEVEVLEEVPGLDVAVFLTNARGVRVLDEAVSDRGPVRFSLGTHSVELAVPALLNTGDYTVGVWIGTSTLDLVDEPAVASFTVEGSDGGRPDRAVVLGLPFTVKQVSA